MSESGYFEVVKFVDISQKGGRIMVKIQWENSSDGNTWEPLENVNPDCVEDFLNELLIDKPVRRKLIRLALERTKKMEESCEEITLSSDSNNTQLTTDPPMKMTKKIKEEVTSEKYMDANLQTNTKTKKTKRESTPKSNPKKKDKKKLITEDSPIDTKIMIKSLLEEAHKFQSRDKELMTSPDPPKPSTCSNSTPKHKIPIPDYRPVIQNTQNYFHINGPGQEILNSFCFSFANFKNSFCPLTQSKKDPADHQFLFADIHTVISPAFVIKGLQVIPLGADNKHMQIRCNVIKNGTRVLRNVESLYASHPDECFLHLKRKLVQIYLLKKFFANYFEKVTSI